MGHFQTSAPARSERAVLTNDMTFGRHNIGFLSLNCNGQVSIERNYFQFAVELCAGLIELNLGAERCAWSISERLFDLW